MQLAARERRLQHVACIHRPLGFAGADHGMQLVDEEDDLAFLLRQVGEHRLQALFEFAAKFRARDEGAHIERKNALVAQALRHFAVDDALRESLDDGGLTDTGLANEHRIVLGPALQYLDRAANLIVAADDRIEFALRGALGQVDAVLLERLAVLLGARVLDFGAASNLLDRLLERLAGGTAGLQDSAEFTAVIARGEDEQLAGNELVAALLGKLIGDD